MGFSRQEYWSGLPFPSPGDLPDPGIEPRSPALQADTLTSEPPGKPQRNFRSYQLVFFKLSFTECLLYARYYSYLNHLLKLFWKLPNSLVRFALLILSHSSWGGCWDSSDQSDMPEHPRLLWGRTVIWVRELLPMEGDPERNIWVQTVHAGGDPGEHGRE